MSTGPSRAISQLWLLERLGVDVHVDIRRQAQVTASRHCLARKIHNLKPAGVTGRSAPACRMLCVLCALQGMPGRSAPGLLAIVSIPTLQHHLRC